MNSITLSGNVGNDPESRTIPSGDTVVTVSIADTFGPKDARKTNWFRCEFWGKRGEVIMKYVKKGNKLTVVGQLKVDTYTDKNGVEKTNLNINVSDFDFGTKASESQSNNSYPVATNPQAATSASNSAPDTAEEDLPF